MTTRFGAPHLDPCQDFPEPYSSILGFLADLWDQVGRFKQDYRGGDEFFFVLLAHLEDQLVALSLVVVIKANTGALR